MVVSKGQSLDLQLAADRQVKDADRTHLEVANEAP